MKTALSLALVLASSSVNEGAVSMGSVTSGSVTEGATALRPAPSGGGGGGSTLDLATLRYNADDLSLADGDEVPSWPSTGTDADASAALVQATASKRPHFDNQDVEMTNNVYFDHQASPPNGGFSWGKATMLMKTGTLASPIDYPAIVCIAFKPDHFNAGTPQYPHLWEAYREAGAATLNHHFTTSWGAANDIGKGGYQEAVKTSQRSGHWAWASYCSELRAQAPSRIARNGELIFKGILNYNNTLPEQTQMTAFSIGSAHETNTTSTTYSYSGKISDVAVWGDIDTLGVSLTDASKDFTAAQGLARQAPYPDMPYAINTWSASTACDTGNQITAPGGPGCNATLTTPQADGCYVRYVFPDGEYKHPPKQTYAQTGNRMYNNLAVCESAPGDLENGHPYIALRPASASVIGSLAISGGDTSPIPGWGGGPWALCMTFRILSYPTTGNKRYLFSQLQGGIQHEEWYLENDAGTTTLKLFGLDTSSVQSVTSIATPSLNTMSALCVNYNDAGSTWALRQDGQAAQTGTWDPSITLYYRAGISKYFFGEIGGRKTPEADMFKVTAFSQAIDAEEVAESFAVQYGF